MPSTHKKQCAGRVFAGHCPETCMLMQQHLGTNTNTGSHICSTYCPLASTAAVTSLALQFMTSFQLSCTHSIQDTCLVLLQLHAGEDDGEELCSSTARNPTHVNHQVSTILPGGQPAGLSCSS